VLVGQLDKAGYTAAARCLTDDLDALVVQLALPNPTPPTMEKYEPARTVTRRGQTPHQGDRPVSGETSCLTLVWAVLDLYINHATNGMKFTQLEHQRLNQTRYQGHQPATPGGDRRI